MKKPYLQYYQRAIIRFGGFEADRLKAHLEYMKFKRELDKALRPLIEPVLKWLDNLLSL